MNKKLITALVAFSLTLPITVQANAAEQKPATLAILDTAIDTSLPVFAGRIVQEVCITEYSSCPNGSSLMEGPGSATLPLSIISKNGFDHGTQVAQAAIKANPGVNIVFVRIVGATKTGIRQNVGEKTFMDSFNWVINNKDKYNIQAVVMSQGHHNLLSGTNYCPTNNASSRLIDYVSSSIVPVFLPAGNDRDTSRLSWPACIPSTVAISASANGDGVANYTNYDPALTDYFALGALPVILPGGQKVQVAGTSISAPVAASIYVYIKSKGLTGTVNEILNSKSIPVNSKSFPGKLLSYEVIYNG